MGREALFGLAPQEQATTFSVAFSRLKCNELAMVLILITLLSAMSGIGPPVKRRDVSEYLLELTGSKFTDCGVYFVGIQGWEQKQKAVLDCAMKTITEQTPFVFKQNAIHVDSVTFEGFVRTSKGDLLRYFYDSAPCGNSSCKESFVTFPCPSPNLYMQGPWLKFRCEAGH